MGILEKEIQWLEKVFDWRLRNLIHHTVQQNHLNLTLEIEDPNYYFSELPCIKETQLTHYEQLILVLSSLPLIDGDFIAAMQSRNPDTFSLKETTGFAYFPVHGGFIPTGETILFLTGRNLSEGTSDKKIFSFLENLISHKWIKLATGNKKSSSLQSMLLLPGETLTQELEKLIEKIKTNPKEMEGKLIRASLQRVRKELSPQLLQELEPIEKVLAERNIIKSSLSVNKKNDVLILFTGEKGTGKNLAAAWLGKNAGLQVYRFDTSRLISKYIGETEKNLSTLFEKASENPAVLFFDEADALFGKRTSVRDAHDKYANQEISYILSMAEKHGIIVILSVTSIKPINRALWQRFQFRIHFP